MDSLRGQIADEGNDGRPDRLVADDDDAGHELPPFAIGQNERRLQVRAYNFWASLLGQRQFPSLSALDRHASPEFARFAVLLDFTAGREKPTIRHIGTALAEECAIQDPIEKLNEVPERTMLSRVAGHYQQIFASQAPTGFEAEFVNWRGATILYRGILLPFSDDDTRIDHVLCVINWKELVDARLADELNSQIEATFGPLGRLRLEPAPLTDWADGPGTFPSILPPPGGPGLAAGAELSGSSDLAERLRNLEPQPLSAVAPQGEEFTLLLARRRPGGEVILLGEVRNDPALVERAAHRLLG